MLQNLCPETFLVFSQVIFILLAVTMLVPAFFIGGIVCFVIACFFYLFDAFWVFFNAITRSRDTPLCDGYQWEGEKDIKVAQVVGGLCLLLVMAGIAIGEGPMWLWNRFVEKTGFSFGSSSP